MKPPNTYTLDQIQATLDSCLDHYLDDVQTREIVTNLGNHLIAELKKLPPAIPELPETPISESAIVRATLLSALSALRFNGNDRTNDSFVHNLHTSLTPILQKP
jgi:hypothetical protein